MALLKRGTVIKSINGKSIQQLADTMFQYISTDGYNNTYRYQRLSSFGAFGSAYTSLYGLSDKYAVDYVAPDGSIQTDSLKVFNIAADTAGRKPVRPRVKPQPKPSRHERREAMLNRSRLLQIDTANKTAMMNLATFTKNYGLRRFFKNSFKTLKENKIQHLIIDVRNNGGGSVSNSTILTRYIANHRFKICDSLFSIRRKTPYHKYIKGYFWNHLFMNLFAARKKDGNFHFGYFERHYFKPKKSNHYAGKVYVLTGGNSFSATTLFVSAVIKQNNVTVIGEETGGGAYGNSAWLLPEVTLPETGVRFRLPLFRLVIDKTVPKIGRGVQPEVVAGPTVEAIRKGADYKLDKAMELIKNDKQQQ